MAPMGTRPASEIGAVTQRQIDYYEKRNKGGVGTIMVEVTSVDYPLGSGTLKNLALAIMPILQGIMSWWKRFTPLRRRPFAKFATWGKTSGQKIEGVCSQWHPRQSLPQIDKTLADKILYRRSGKSQRDDAEIFSLRQYCQTLTREG